MDVRTYTYTRGVGLTEPADAAPLSPDDPDDLEAQALRGLQVGGQAAAGAIGAVLTYAPGPESVELVVTVDAATGSIDVQRQA